MYIIAVGVSHRTTPIEIREKLAFDNTQIALTFEHIKARGVISGCVIISTCNRTEIYATSKDVSSAQSEIWNFLSDKSGIEIERLQNYLYNITCEQAVTHLFRVASGLDSMIIGEMEILGQIFRAYQIACENSASNSVLNVLFQKAIRVGKKVRTETRIGNGSSSIGAAAVELAKQTFGDIHNCSILLIGAGEMGSLVARNLSNNGVSEVMVCNRSYDKAQELAIQFNGCAVSFDSLSEYMIKADLILSCTFASNYIITKEELARVIEMRCYKPMLLIDLAVPRDIEPESSQLDSVDIYNIDDLQDIVNRSLEERKIEAEKAEIIVDNAIDNLFKWLNNFHVVPVIKALCQKGEEIRDNELEKAIRKLGHLNEREDKIIRSMAYSIASKLINIPIVQLKEHSNKKQGYMYAQMTKELFNLSVQMENQFSDSW